jgi:hypothetical protein
MVEELVAARLGNRRNELLISSIAQLRDLKITECPVLSISCFVVRLYLQCRH